MHGESYAPLITDAQIEAMRLGPVSWRNAVETPTVPGRITNKGWPLSAQMGRSHVELGSPMRLAAFGMTQDRPEEFELHRLNPPTRDEGENDFGRRRFANVIALPAMVAIVLVGYWVFHALGHSRRLQRCLDSGRSNCVDFVNPAK